MNFIAFRVYNKEGENVTNVYDWSLSSEGFLYRSGVLVPPEEGYTVEFYNSKYPRGFLN